ncbi:MAG: peptide chain release factor 1 [Simkaniaceae bacterium]|nr:peptide chain release factor 1 [Simkaniaceae bacterium]
MEAKIQELLKKLDGVEDQLGQPEVVNDKVKFRELTQQHAYLSELKEVWQSYQKAVKDIADNEELIKEESDPEFVAIAKEELPPLYGKKEKLQQQLHSLIVPPDPTDSQNTILELRAGTGGDEAALFVGDCVRMYKLYAGDKGWTVDPLSYTESEIGGYKEYIMVLSGKDVYRLMKYEAGTHRVQRVPETEAQGRVHTSAITVAVLLEPAEDEEIHIDETELKIDTYRASGAGGQHVNTTDSAVRITHMPTGTVVYCQQERSQHKNKDKAMRLLAAKLAEESQRKKHEERSSLRQSQVGSGDRSERIRTYNFPQNRLTDHRINLTLYKLDQIMNGDLDMVTQALVAHFYQKSLENAGV